MFIEYYSEYKGGVKRFYVTMSIFVEKPDPGQEVYLYIGFQSMNGGDWDIGRCHVQYDGVVNMKFRSYTVTDHFSPNLPYDGGLDKNLILDKN